VIYMLAIISPRALARRGISNLAAFRASPGRPVNGPPAMR